MHLPPLSSPVISGYYSSGDVSIAGDVVMGSGVILQANPGYCIRLHDGVCLGLGVILHASEGNIIVSPGAILGAGVLVVGWAEIGTRACIGSAATLFKTTIASGQMVTPGSLLGQRGRSSEAEGRHDRPEDHPHTVPGSFSLGHPPQTADPEPRDSATAAAPEPQKSSQATTQQTSNSQTTDHPPQPPTPKKNTVVYGKDYFLQMRFAMFPSQS
ncbi:MAG: hypothetical protein ACO37W_13255 [Prochlorotrichaceae cyanobacterium]